MKLSEKSIKTKGRHTLIRILAAILSIAFAIITQTGCGNKEFSKNDFVLNTTCSITISGMSEDEAEAVLTEAFKVLREYERLLSRTIEESDIYKINHSGGTPVEVSDDTAEVIRQGMMMGDLSEGKFDITIGKLTQLWGFTGEDPKVPSAEKIFEMMGSVDYKKVKIEGNTVTLLDPDAAVDLGGIAKGYIADRLDDLLREKGVNSAMINLGGNVVLIGEKPDGSLWNVGIQRPYSDRTAVIGSVKAADSTLVTSGTYERKFEEDGVIYHHVLDPDTGYPVDTDLESVTIKAKRGNSSFCDGLSTVCLMLGEEKAENLVETLQNKYPEMALEAAFIDKNDDMVQTDGMNIQLEDQEE